MITFVTFGVNNYYLTLNNEIPRKQNLFMQTLKTSYCDIKSQYSYNES
jgi:hypothetical protein